MAGVILSQNRDDNNNNNSINKDRHAVKYKQQVKKGVSLKKKQQKLIGHEDLSILKK